MILRFRMYAGIALIAATCAWSGSRQDLAAYLAGVELLQSADHLSANIVARRYHELVHLTGIDAPEAAALIEQYKNRPEQWKRVQEMIATNLEQEQTDTKEHDNGK
jgi:hypothetical protein